MGIVLAAVVLAAGAAIVRREPSAGGDDVSSVIRRADGLIGQRVTVRGRVGDVISAKSLTLTDDAHQMLVLDVSVIPAVDNDLDGVVVDELLEVSGVLRTFAFDEVERHVGELVDERHDSFVGQPVILADSFVPL